MRKILVFLSLFVTINLHAQDSYVGISYGAESLVGLPGFEYRQNFSEKSNSRGYISLGVDIFFIETFKYTFKVAPGYQYKSSFVESSFAFTGMSNRGKKYNHISITPKVGYGKKTRFKLGPTFYLSRSGYLPGGIHDAGKIKNMNFSFDIFTLMENKKKE